MTSGYREDQQAANQRRRNWLDWVVGGTVALSCFAVTTYFEDVLKANTGLSNDGYRFFEWIVFFAVMFAVSRLLPRAADGARPD
jgi:hypothetical protein